MSTLIIKNASEIVTCSGFYPKSGKDMNDLHILYDSAIYIENGIIKDISSNDSILNKYKNVDKIIDATNKSVLPGFVDSHTHLVFGGSRENEFGMRVEGKSYSEIMKSGGGIINSVNATKNSSEEELYKKAKEAINSMVSFGVTTIEAKSGYGLDIETELKQLKVAKKLNDTMKVSIYNTFLGAHSFPTEYKDKKDEYVDFLIEKVLPLVKEKNLAEFCDIFVEDNVFNVKQAEKIFNAAKNLGFSLKIHSDEIKDIGGSILASEMSAVSADHLLVSNDQSLNKLIKNGVICTLLPLTALSLKENFARARYIIDNGGVVALASDYNPGSCFSENMALVVFLACMYMGMTIEEAITAITINGASAIKKEKEIGSIDINKNADIVILNEKSYKFIPYHIGVSSVSMVIKNGEVIFNK